MKNVTIIDNEGMEFLNGINNFEDVTCNYVYCSNKNELIDSVKKFRSDIMIMNFLNYCTIKSKATSKLNTESKKSNLGNYHKKDIVVVDKFMKIIDSFTKPTSAQIEGLINAA